MQTLMKFTLICFTPVLCVIYWRNSMRELDNLHADYERLLPE